MDRARPLANRHSCSAATLPPTTIQTTTYYKSLSSSTTTTTTKALLHHPRGFGERRHRRAILRYLFPIAPRTHRVCPRRGHRPDGIGGDGPAAVFRGGGPRLPPLHVHQQPRRQRDGRDGHVRHDAVHPAQGPHHRYGTGGLDGLAAAGGGIQGLPVRPSQRHHNVAPAQWGCPGNGLGHSDPRTGIAAAAVPPQRPVRLPRGTGEGSPKATWRQGRNQQHRDGSGRNLEGGRNRHGSGYLHDGGASAKLWHYRRNSHQAGTE
mmetsp:Transcript_8338/g.24654  ORF Transcript_8338/g.24654 Transcript_8338/m.24654 type:complete len:263 (-) Transcript_8338:536-1324(-)